MRKRRVTPHPILLALLIWPTAMPCAAQLRPLTAAERSAIVATVLTRTEVATLAAKPSELRALSVVPAEAPDKKDTASEAGRFAQVLVIAKGRTGAMRLLVSVPDARVLSSERLPGRPQSSAAEREEARRILADAGSTGGAPIEGGFVVDPPRGAPAEGRYLEFHLLSADRSRILHQLTVELWTGKVWEQADDERH